MRKENNFCECPSPKSMKETKTGVRCIYCNELIEFEIVKESYKKRLKLRCFGCRKFWGRRFRGGRNG